MTKRRTHLLLEPDQHHALAKIADREGRSVSDLAREIVREGIEQRKQLFTKDMMIFTWHWRNSWMLRFGQQTNAL